MDASESTVISCRSAGHCPRAGQCKMALRGPFASGAGISRLGTTTRRNGSHQLTLGGHPLYRFIKDKTPGDTKGQNVDAFGAEWYVLNGSGKKIEKH